MSRDFEGIQKKNAVEVQAEETRDNDAGEREKIYKMVAAIWLFFTHFFRAFQQWLVPKVAKLGYQKWQNPSTNSGKDVAGTPRRTATTRRAIGKTAEAVALCAAGADGYSTHTQRERPVNRL